MSEGDAAERPSITAFYTDDHDRLDALLLSFEDVKEREPAKALNLLEKFKFELEQHMAWEEAILFPAFDAQHGHDAEDGPTADLRAEHEQIRDYLETVIRKRRAGDFDTQADEARMAQMLAAHNRDEESGLYRLLDERLSAAERADIYRQMEGLALDA